MAQDRVRNPQPQGIGTDRAPITIPPQPPPSTQTDGLAQDRADSTAIYAPFGVTVVDPHTPPTLAPRTIDLGTAPRPTVEDVGQNMLDNPGFENTSAGTWVATNGTINSILDGGAHSGARDAEIIATAAAALSVAGPTGVYATPVKPSFGYRFRCWTWTGVTARTLTLTLTWYDAAGRSISTSTATQLETVATWVQLDSFWVQAPTNAAYVGISLSWGVVANGERHYLDDLELFTVGGANGDSIVFGTGAIKSFNFRTGVSGWAIDGLGNSEFNNITMRGRLSAIDGPNLIVDPGAESALPASYYTVDAGGTSVVQDAPGTPHSGTKSFKVTTSAGAAANGGVSIQYAADKNAARVIKVDPTKVYRVSGYVFGTVAATFAQIFVFWWTAGGVQITPNGVTTSLPIQTGTWNYHNGSFIPPSNAAYATLAFSYTRAAMPASELLWWDDLYFGVASDVTAGLFQTSTAGERGQLYSGGGVTLNMYTGDYQEVFPMSMVGLLSTVGEKHSQLRIDAGALNASPGSTATITLLGESQAAALKSEIDVYARTLLLGDNNVASQIQMQGTLFMQPNFGIDRLDFGTAALSGATSSGTDNVWTAIASTTTIFAAGGTKKFKIIARYFGDIFNVAAATSIAGFVRVGYSTNGGSTWTYGPTPKAQVGTTAGANAVVPYMTEVVATISSWTTSFQIRAEIMKQGTGATTVGSENATLNWQIIPAA